MDGPTRARYDAHKDVDFSYEVPGVVRVRCNIYEQSKGSRGRVPHAAEPDPVHGAARRSRAPREAHRASARTDRVHGPSGTGKSSTLAALIDHINRTRKKHILTIEDPISTSIRTNGASSRSAKSAATRRRSRRRPTARCAGPGRDHGRRNARHRDHGARDDRGRHGASSCSRRCTMSATRDGGPHPRLVRRRASGASAPHAVGSRS